MPLNFVFCFFFIFCNLVRTLHLQSIQFNLKRFFLSMNVFIYQLHWINSMHFSVICPKWHTEEEKKTIKKSDTARRQQIQRALQSVEYYDEDAKSSAQHGQQLQWQRSSYSNLLNMQLFNYIVKSFNTLFDCAFVFVLLFLLLFQNLKNACNTKVSNKQNNKYGLRCPAVCLQRKIKLKPFHINKTQIIVLSDSKCVRIVLCWWNIV